VIPFLFTLFIIPLSLSGAIGKAEAGFASETTGISRLDYLFTQFRVIVTYLRLLVFPVHQNLDYDYPIYHSLSDTQVFFSFLFLFFLFSLACYLLFYSQHKLVVFGFLWFFLTLSIESSIIPIQGVIYEHRLYLPSVGFMLAGSVFMAEFLHRWRHIAAIMFGITVVVLSMATYERNRVWKDEVTLWTNVVQESPNRPRGYINLGTAYMNQDRQEEAIQAYQNALTLLTLKPDLLAQVHNNLGNAYKKLGRLEEAIQAYQTALSLKSDLAEPHNNLGIVYEKQGHLEKAIQAYKTALTLKPDYPQAHYNLGNAYAMLGSLEEASQAYKSALTLKPDLTQAHNNLGNVYHKLGRFEEAIREYQIVLKQYPDLVETHYNLGSAYHRTGQIQEAIHEFERVLQIKPDDEKARQALESLPRH
jgi:tetratricopeptide (TPR) repeat protein